MLPDPDPDKIARARGASSQPASRFDTLTSAREDDGWTAPDPKLIRTEITHESPRKVITRNTSPDVPFDRSLNPYRGCEHGCIYCFARPTHAYLGLSPGLDFETRITAKTDIAARLEAEIGAASYRVAPLAFGTNTDPYQPVEAQLALMPPILDVLARWNHPLTIATRGATVLRDLPMLQRMADRGQVSLGISVTTLDAQIARRMEPRAPTPKTRLQMISKAAQAGIPVRVMVSPLIPWLTESELERILTAAREAGATTASMIPLRMPLEVAPLVEDWLQRHYPDQAAHIMNRIRAIRGGKVNDSRFGHRFRGEGVFADLLRDRFVLARKRLGYHRSAPPLDCSRFGPPPHAGQQLSLF